MVKYLHLDSMCVLIFIWITVFLWVLSQANIDAEHIKKKEFINNHASRMLSRCLVGVLAGILNWKAGVIVGLVFWAVFDQALNYFRGLDLFYFGTVAKSDIFFSKRIDLYTALKLIAFLGSITIIFI